MSDQQGVIIFGAGGHTRSLINVLERSGIDILGVFDDSYEPGTEELISGYPLTGKFEDADEKMGIVLGIGSNRLREEFFKKYSGRVYRDNIIHPDAIIEKRVTLGQSSHIFARVFLNNEAWVGDNVILNSGCIIEHEAVIGSHTHVSVGSVICGRAKVGDGCFIGAGSVVNDYVTVTSGVTVGSGSVVIRDITEPGTYVGCPVRRVK